MSTKRKTIDSVTVEPKNGRKSTFTQEIADQVCARVSQGEPLAAVCRDMKIGLTTWYDWVRVHPELAEKIARAREAGHDMIAVDAMRIIDEPPPVTPNGGTDAGYVSWQKHRVWTRLQLLAKWDPKRYGDKLAIGGADDLPPVQQNVTVDPGEAYKRLIGGGE